MRTEVSPLNPNTVRSLATLLMRQTTDTAFERLRDEARKQKQSIREIAWRRASNLLRSLSLHQAN